MEAIARKRFIRQSPYKIRYVLKMVKGSNVNLAINKTLSRTLMTSGTTLLVLISLVLLGGVLIFDFALVMLIGVFFGTLSSLFIAPPLLVFFHNRERNKIAIDKVSRQGSHKKNVINKKQFA